MPLRMLAAAVTLILLPTTLPAQESDAERRLRVQGKQFEEEIIQVADKPYLGEFYGNVEWSVRSVFNGYLGWFDGNPTNLFRLSQREEARRRAELAGGADTLLKRAQQAFDSGDPQWSCQLTDYLIALDHEAIAAKRIKADALTKLGENCVTATGRNYYLTVAQELRNSLQPVPNPGKQQAK